MLLLRLLHVLNKTSIHNINKFDTSKRWFLFEEDVVVTYPNRVLLSLSVIFGPWAGHGCRLFELVGDRSKAIAAADKVSQILPVRGMLECLLPPTADAPEHASRERKGVYLALGGPGVGKTSGRVVECIQDVCVHGHACSSRLQSVSGAQHACWDASEFSCP